MKKSEFAENVERKSLLFITKTTDSAAECAVLLLYCGEAKD
jgi:hypothetical protein